MLRRTGFARKVYAPPPIAPLRPIEGCRGVITPVSGVVVATPKSSLIRSESYRRFVAAHACFACAIAGYSQCAHDNFEKGLAIKVCDTRSFPLCTVRPGHIGCHTQFDLCIDMTRDERREIGALYVARMREIARAARRPEIRLLEAA